MPETYPLENPLDIDAISCRLSIDLHLAAEGVHACIPAHEMRLILGILEAAREYVREQAPNEHEKRGGHGTATGVSESAQRLIVAVKSDVNPTPDTPTGDHDE